MVVQCAVMLSQDSFYRGLTQEELANVGDYDFDSPGALDTQAMVQCLEDLKAMKAVEVPIYDFTTHQRSGQEHFSDAPFLGWVGAGRDGTGSESCCTYYSSKSQILQAIGRGLTTTIPPLAEGLATLPPLVL